MNVYVTCPNIPIHNKVVNVIHVISSVTQVKFVMLSLKIVVPFSNTVITTWKHVLLMVLWLTLILTLRLDGTIKTMMATLSRQNWMKLTT